MFGIVPLLSAQQRQITGTVTDNSGVPLPGVNIIVKGTSTGTQSDFDGNYTISAAANQTLVFTYVGFASREVSVGNQANINVSLEEGESLEEVVVVGFGTREEDKVIQTISVVEEAELEDIPSGGSPQNLLQGQSSGVQITGASGVLGARTSVRVRGVNSLTGGAQPLFVVDGVPIDDSSQTFGLGGGAVNPLASINAEDIATFTVLKDAAATAIYGSRGSNGVILITTKKGKKNQKPVFTLESFIQVSSATDVPKVLTNQQYGQFYSDVLNIQNDTDTFTPESLRDDFGIDYTGPGFDWLDAATRTGYSYSQNLSVRGGGENSTYYLGVNHTDSEGFIIGNNLETTGLRLNLGTDISDNFRAGANASYTYSQNDRINEENSTFAAFTAGQLITPNITPTDEDGNFVPSGQTGQNFVGIEALNTSLVNTTRFIGNAYVEADFFDQFTYRLSVGIDQRFVENRFRSSEVFTPGGSAEVAIAEVDRFIVNNTLNWNNSFGNHNVSALMGTSFERTNTYFSDVSSTGFLTDALPNVGSGSTAGDFSVTTSGNRLIGYFGQANYDYDGRYLLEGSIRRDGSSRFGENNRFGTFYAVAAGWNIARETFMDGSIFNRLALRASIGTTGNDRIGDFSRFATFGSADYNGNPGLTNTNAANPDLKWEETESFDVGIKSAFLDNRIRFDANYYRKTTTDLLIPVPVPPATGVTSVTRNAGSLENSGFEFDLGVTPVRSQDFEWNININLSTIQNEVTELPGAGTDSQGRQFLQGTPVQRAIVGESANSFYTVRFAGINPDTGDAEWFDINGNRTSTYSANDRVIVGDANPDFYGGLRTTFQYKNFDLSALFNFSVGNDILIDGFRFSRNPNFVGSFNLDPYVLDYWTPTNTVANVPSPASSTFGTYANQSTLQLLDGSYLRFKNVTVGYNLPSEFLSNTKLFSSVRIYATATNLFTIKGDELDGVDPEVTDSLNPLALGESFFVAPQSKSYVVGLKASF